MPELRGFNEGIDRVGVTAAQAFIGKEKESFILATPGRAPTFTKSRQGYRAADTATELIEMLVEDSYVTPVVSMTTDRRLTGYALARRGTAAAYLGPLVATVADAATLLLDGLLSQVSGQRVYVDLNTSFGGGREILASRGLVKQRDLIRMSYGQKNGAGTSPSIFAIAGPEVG